MKRILVTVVVVAIAGMGSGSAMAADIPEEGATQPDRVAPKAALGQAARQGKIAAFKHLVTALGKVPKSCRLKGKKLQGKVKVVKSFPDFKVKVVSSFPDLKVKWVKSFPNKCGLWKKVKSFPDFKIKFVKSFPDFKIKIVSSFPGVP